MTRTDTDTDSEVVYESHWALFPFLFARRYMRRWYAQFVAMRARSKAIVFLLLAFYVALAITIAAVGPKKISHAVYAGAQHLRATWFGPFILGFLMIIASVPPMIGFTTTATLCGFVFGLWGYLIAAPATYLGSAVAFIVLRMAFRQRIRAWANDSPNWRALGAVMKAKGLFLICLVRLVPLPWTASNALFASVDAVSFTQFMLATTVILPKVFIAVFVGSRLAMLADGEELDATAKWVNSISIVVAIATTAITGVYVWRITRAEIEKLESIPQEQRRQAEHLIEDLEEAPLVEQPYTD